MVRVGRGVIDAVLAQYEIHGAEVGAPLHGYRTTLFPVTRAEHEPVLLMFYKSEPDILTRIRRTMELERTLADAGLPVRRPHDDRVLRLAANDDVRYVSVSEYLSGATIPWEAYTMKHIKLLGWALGELHQSMQAVQTSKYPSVYEEYEKYLARMRDYFSQAGVRDAMRRKLQLSIDIGLVDSLATFIQSAKTEPGQQVLHMDFVRGNVLFAAGSDPETFSLGGIQLSGILDFEKAATGHVEFDLGRTLAFLLADCSNKTAAQIRKYFLHSGYEKRGHGHIQNRNRLQRAIDACLLHDLYAFLVHNPYESLAENYHYCRTRDILIARKMVQYV